MLEWAYTNISSITNVEYTYYYSLMDIKKQKKVTTYKYDKDKKRTLAGEMLARRMISTYCNVVPEEISFETGCYGKPNAKHLNVEFNISHLCCNTAIQRSCPCRSIFIDKSGMLEALRKFLCKKESKQIRK